MTDSYRALVVDDEAVLRILMMRALCREGFTCDAAGNGLEAGKLAQSQRYDVVITDLMMPDRNGHALACELLQSADRPLIVIVTGVLEPRLAKDLITRGADCIEFKPVNYAMFAAKVRGLVRHRSPRGAAGAAGGPHCGGCQAEAADCGEPPADCDVAEKLSRLSKTLPISQSALDVFQMTSAGNTETSQIAAAISRDASLSADILRLANSAYYDPAGRKVVELQDAVLRIGQRRVGELALAMSTFAALTSSVLPWMNLDLTWRRSVAAGVAMELLAPRVRPAQSDGLFLSAIMHPLGRVALGMLYSRQYQAMVKACAASNDSLREKERRMFGLAHEEVTASLLKAWGIPEEVYAPLKHGGRDYGLLSRLEDPFRTRAELLKIAVLIARIAAGTWENWDQLELPPASPLRRLGIESSLAKIIQMTKSRAQEIIRFQPPAPGEEPHGGNRPPAASPASCLKYCSLSAEPFDFLSEIIPSLEMSVQRCELSAVEPDEAVVVNCIGCPPHRLIANIDPRRSDRSTLIVTELATMERFSRLGQVLALPASYGALRAACERIAQAPQGQRPSLAAGRR